MQLTEYIPSEELKPYIRCFKIIESRYGTTNLVLPGTSFTMAFCFKGQVSYLNESNNTPLDFATFSGLQKSARYIKYDTDTSAIIVLFKETGLPAFFKQPLHELSGKSVSLDNFFLQREIVTLQERLSESKDNGERIAVLEMFLLSKLTHFSADQLINAAISKINSANGNIRIKELTRQLYISQDAFEKRFRKMAGVTPKHYSHIVKLNSLIRHIQTVPSFLDMAFENGYYDQPHFNKDFKKFTGQTPTDFFRSALYW